MVENKNNVQVVALTKEELASMIREAAVAGAQVAA